MADKWFDPVVEEVRQRGRAYTERFGHDIHAIAEDLRKDYEAHPERYVSQITIVPESPTPNPQDEK